MPTNKKPTDRLATQPVAKAKAEPKPKATLKPKAEPQPKAKATPKAKAAPEKLLDIIGQELYVGAIVAASLIVKPTEDSLNAVLRLGVVTKIEKAKFKVKTFAIKNNTTVTEVVSYPRDSRTVVTVDPEQLKQMDALHEAVRYEAGSVRN